MEFDTPSSQTAIYKILAHQLPVPRDMNSLYAVAAQAGLSQEEFDLLKTSVQGGLAENDEYNVWNDYRDMQAQSTAETPNDPMRSNNTVATNQFIDPSVSYKPTVLGPRPAQLDSNVGTDDTLKYYDNLDAWERVNSTPTAKVTTAAMGALGAPQFAIQQLLQKLTSGAVDTATSGEVPLPKRTR